MALPYNLSETDYYNLLSGCRDEAIERSHTEGARFRLGWLTMGNVTAEWATATSGIAVLRDHGLCIGRTALQPQPTQLNFYDMYDVTGGFRIQTYDMDLTNGNGITGHATYIRSADIGSPRAAAARREPIELTLNHYMRIYNEMERGAAGTFRCQVNLPNAIV